MYYSMSVLAVCIVWSEWKGRLFYVMHWLLDWRERDIDPQNTGQLPASQAVSLVHILEWL